VKVEVRQRRMQDNPERFIAIQNNQGRDVFTSMILVPDEVAIPAPTTGPFRAAPTPDQTYQHSSGMQAVLDAEATMGEENTRDLLYRFWNLSSSQRRDIATSLGLLKDGEMKLPEPERYGRALIRAVELQILSAAVLARLFSTLPDAAVAVLNASFGGMRTVDLPMDLPDLAKRALVEFSRRKHARPGEKEFEIVAPKVDFEVSPEAVANMSGGFFIVASRRRVSHLRGSRVGFEDDARTLHGKPPFAPVASTLTCKVTSSRGSITARPSASRRAKHSARSSPSSRETPLQDRRRRSLKSLRQKKSAGRSS
jgi:hypothetical protein